MFRLALRGLLDKGETYYCEGVDKTVQSAVGYTFKGVPWLLITFLL